MRKLSSIQQRVFCVFLRTRETQLSELWSIPSLSNVITSSDPNLKEYYKEALDFPEDAQLNSRGKLPFNDSNYFTTDFWYLHSTWISFDRAKEAAKKLIDACGYDNVMLNSFVPVDTEILPNK